LLGIAVICLVLAGLGQQTVKGVSAVPRAFVSTSGSDTNPCSAAQPCRSFNQALTVVEPGGEIVVQNSGGYSTGFTITQSVTIDATGVNASVISTSATDLCTINTGATDRVVLRGISFHGASLGTNAINVTQVGSLYLEHCSISEFTGDGVHMPNGGNLWVTDTDVRRCPLSGLDVESGATAAHFVARDSGFTECTEGVLLQTQGAATATGLISNCIASLCEDGFFVISNSAGNADLTLTNCRAFGNTSVGLVATTISTGNATMRVSNCVVTDNLIGISRVSFGAGVPSVLGSNPGTNLISGNASLNSTTGNVALQ
jgi:hypothetical protein